MCINVQLVEFFNYKLTSIGNKRKYQVTGQGVKEILKSDRKTLNIRAN